MKMGRMKPAAAVSSLLDRAEGLRRAGKIGDGLELIEGLVRENPDHPRALLLWTRLLFERGSFSQALEALKALSFVPACQGELRLLRKGLEHLAQLEAAEPDPAFATESMARLLVQQGYLLEAMEIYRRLFLTSAGEGRFWEEMRRIRDRLEGGGSRDKSREGLDGELAAWDRWMQKRKRGS
ncbi:MAG: hypothetical protein A2038_07060 [Deltaproteobacteria bacterium GWA2_57_13]|nr:MAG: hypothetical protein A2038_07060 [Deltaproteobacteria bacterium GWA2_57_13]OGQ49938.1 MAG: hypothetical protein A3I10_01460 [Deltaproteobacteria bacterium RIFCSPLOWO2_02_FULL_57_26]OGQ74238.1 MAG: hypothetical protein A3G40_15370 [Deltaproteobacteria bacterium RIFCSPLOWO2_12_FULL_57_22]